MSPWTSTLFSLLAPWRMSVTISSKSSCSKMKTPCLFVEQMLSTLPVEPTRWGIGEFTHIYTPASTHINRFLVPFALFWPLPARHLLDTLCAGQNYFVYRLSLTFFPSVTHLYTHAHSGMFFTCTLNHAVLWRDWLSYEAMDIDGWLSQLSRPSSHVFIFRCTLTRSI